MNGGFNMKKIFKTKFALTDTGAKGLTKASFISGSMFLVNMLPAMLLMFFLDEILLMNIHDEYLYYGASLIVLLVMYIIYDKEYDATYTSTYEESASLRMDIARTLKELPLSYFSKHNLSDISQTFMSDVEAIEHAMSHAMSKTVGFFMFLPIISILLIGGNVKLGLAVIVPVILNFTLTYISKEIQIKHTLKHYKKLRSNSDNFQEAIEMGQDIKSFSLSKKTKEDLYKRMEEGEKLQLKSNAIQSFFVLLAGFISHIAIGIVILVGADLYIKGDINILYFIAYILASMKLKEGVDMITENIAELYYLDSRVERISNIRKAEIQKGSDREINNFDIEFENVSFSYDSSNKILKDISFIANQGEVTALVGMSGCGKTSILRLISRLYDYDDGKILIDGKDIKTVSTKSLFEKISIVFQDVTLFNASAMENIRIGRKDASEEEVKEAARLANCEEFIMNLPKGYDTYIGENGASLSGGQRQRLSIARAFLKNAPIIILDEIAAALDVENEKKIQDSLNKLTKDKTVIIISHRLKAIENVDKIVVIQDGKIEADGRHEELLNKSIVYKNLVEKARLAEGYKY